MTALLATATDLALDVMILAQDLNPQPQAPPGLGPQVNSFLGWMMWIGLAAGIGGFMASGIMMSVGRRNRSAMAADGAAGIPWNVAGLALVGLAVSLASAILRT